MEKDIIVTCPYNKAHRIRKYKLMTHLVKCKKQHDITNKISCPLNSSHIMDQSDMRVCINLYIELRVFLYYTITIFYNQYNIDIF